MAPAISSGWPGPNWLKPGMLRPMLRAPLQLNRAFPKGPSSPPIGPGSNPSALLTATTPFSLIALLKSRRAVPSCLSCKRLWNSRRGCSEVASPSNSRGNSSPINNLSNMWAPARRRVLSKPPPIGRQSSPGPNPPLAPTPPNLACFKRSGGSQGPRLSQIWP